MDKWLDTHKMLWAQAQLLLIDFLVALKESYIGSIEYEDSLEL